MKIIKKLYQLLVLLALPIAVFGQIKTTVFSHDDTLRGTYNADRAWWDLTFYDLKIRVNPADSSVSGSNTIYYKVLKPAQTLQLDLQPPLSISRIEQDGQAVNFEKIGTNAYQIHLTAAQRKGSIKSLTAFFGGKPRVARNAPWDGGFSWDKDATGSPFVATSCQGLGASAWWVCKDHMADEVDSMAISVTVPKDLTDISNGRLRKITKNADGTRTFHWFVKNPINNYGVNVNIGRYVRFSEDYAGEKGKLTLDFFVLPEDVAKAKVQFKQAAQMMKAFEHWFGPYPFYEDGYKLVEVPYLGMEHQSSVTYGNHFQNGYLGRDLSGSGWGLKWDYIIIHESGHEWFANNITYKDIADMWIHESFTMYGESLFTEFYYGKTAGAAYARGVRSSIQNDKPIIGAYNVNNEGSSDMYYKGSNMLHTIRQIVGDDEKWRQILRGLNRDFFHQTVDTKQIENYMSQKAGVRLDKVFDQYLRDVRVPVLEYKFSAGKMAFRWTNSVEGFDMPVKVYFEKGKATVLNPTNSWQEVAANGGGFFGIDEDFYVESKRVE